MGLSEITPESLMVLAGDVEAADVPVAGQAEIPYVDRVRRKDAHTGSGRTCTELVL